MRTPGRICVFFVPLSQQSVRYPALDTGLLSSVTFCNRVSCVSNLETNSDETIANWLSFCECQT